MAEVTYDYYPTLSPMFERFSATASFASGSTLKSRKFVNPKVVGVATTGVVAGESAAFSFATTVATGNTPGYVTITVFGGGTGRASEFLVTEGV